MKGIAAVLSHRSPARRHALILTAFVTAQFLDIVTTHLGLVGGREELNGFASYLILNHGEAFVYAAKLSLVGALLGLLALIGPRRPSIWNLYLVAAWVTTAAVVNNVIRIVV